MHPTACPNPAHVSLSSCPAAKASVFDAPDSAGQRRTAQWPLRAKAAADWRCWCESQEKRIRDFIIQDRRKKHERQTTRLAPRSPGRTADWLEKVKSIASKWWERCQRCSVRGQLLRPSLSINGKRSGRTMNGRASPSLPGTLRLRQDDKRTQSPQYPLFARGTVRWQQTRSNKKSSPSSWRFRHVRS